MLAGGEGGQIIISKLSHSGAEQECRGQQPFAGVRGAPAQSHHSLGGWGRKRELESPDQHMSFARNGMHWIYYICTICILIQGMKRC